MKPSFFLLFKIFLFFLPIIGFAQVAEEKSRFISGIDIGIDALKPLSYLVDFEDKYEASLGLMFYNKVTISGEYGFASLTPKQAIENGYYKSEGNYFRIGADYHKALNPQDQLYIGLMYGQSTFFDEYNYRIESTLWEDYQSPTFIRKNQTASWYELILGSERTYGKYFLLGFKVRLRIKNQFEQHEVVHTFTIPGFGYADRTIMPAANIYLKFRLPL